MKNLFAQKNMAARIAAGLMVGLTSLTGVAASADSTCVGVNVGTPIVSVSISHCWDTKPEPHPSASPKAGDNRVANFPGDDDPAPPANVPPTPWGPQVGRYNDPSEPSPFNPSPRGTNALGGYTVNGVRGRLNLGDEFMAGLGLGGRTGLGHIQPSPRPRIDAYSGSSFDDPGMPQMIDGVYQVITPGMPQMIDGVYRVITPGMPQPQSR